MPPITANEVHAAISGTKPNKAPGPDGIPNLVLQRLLPLIDHYLTNLFNACLRLHYCPEHFRCSRTVVIRKPRKPSYADPKAYRPIALLSTIGKALEAIFATRMSYLVEKYNLLPRNHMGGRRGRSCEHALHTLLERTHREWRDGNAVASGLALDVSGAFDNVNHKRLLHNLRRRQVPEDLVLWIESFLTGRRTSIILMEGNMGEFPVTTGIPQGSPLSPILFLFFNADLIDEIQQACPGTLVIGYIDDILIVAFGDTATENCRTLSLAHQVAERWEKKHASKFGPAKYQLAHFWRKHRSVPKPDGALDVPLVIRGVEVKPKKSIKYLGVRLDANLTGEAQIRKMRKRAAPLLAGLASIAGSTWGTPLLHLRRMYTAVLLPQIMYACSTWYIRAGHGLQKQQRAAEAAARSIQYQALHRISGAFRRTSRQAMEVCLYVPPPELTLARLAEEACLRIMTSPLRRALHRTRGTAHINSPLTSPLHRLERAVDTSLGRGICGRIETIEPFVVPPWWQPPETSISENREAALAAYGDHPPLQFFTDGSGFDEGIGAGAYSPSFGEASLPVGSSATHTVYAGELEGVNQALTIIGKQYEYDGPKGITIYTDNQAAIRACSAPRRSSGQYILRRIVQRLDSLQAANWQIRIQWIPGHEGVPGNEEADRLAKLAAQDAIRRTRNIGRRMAEAAPTQATPHAPRMTFDPLFPHRNVVLVAVCRQRLRASYATRWKRQWEIAEHGRHLYRVLAEPKKKLLALHAGLKRAWSSVLVQLQTGKSALRSFLASVKIEDSPLCPCGFGHQDSEHVLTSCPTHRQLRQQTLWKERRETDFRRLLSEPAWVKKTIEFALRTGLLTQFRCAPPPESRSQ